ncbi:TIGR00266 family protein [Candidatus Latescibacterota bacterium]
MAHQIDYKLVGDDMQAVVITLDPGEIVQAEAGSMMFMESDIEMNTEMQGGLLGGIKRKLGGESLFITTFKNTGSKKKHVSFAAPYPGKIVSFDLAETGTMLCQRDAYLCSAFGIDISVAFTKRLGAGFFGGEGFILQKLSGDGYTFVHAGGTVIKHELGTGEFLKVDTGCLVAFEESVSYDIEMTKGIKTALFGGEGLFLAKLSGPGIIYLQTLPFARMANRVISAAGYAGSKGEVRRGGVGGILGDIISGD